jgi:dTDP-4-dehydrorhamnose 3,5-epimerase-like enzyme
MAARNIGAVLGHSVRVIRLGSHEDGRGRLHSIDFSALPFQPQRAFVVEADTAGTTRGGHAHRTASQLLIRLSGAIEVEVVRGGHEARIVLDRTEDALLIEPLVWARQTYLVADSSLLVFASEPYDEADYVFDRDAFPPPTVSDDTAP